MAEGVTDIQHITAGDGHEQEEAHAAPNGEQNLQASAKEEAKSDEEEDTEQPAVKDGPGSEEVEKNGTPSKEDDGGCGENSAGTQTNEELDIKPDDISGLKNASETTSPSPCDAQDEDVNEPKIQQHEENQIVKDILIGAGGDGPGSEEVEKNGTPSKEDGGGCGENSAGTQTNEELDIKPDDISGLKNVSETTSLSPCDAQDDDVNEPKIQHHEENQIVNDIQIGAGVGSRRLWAVAAMIVLVAMVIHLFHPKPPPENSDVRQIDIFLRQLEKMKPHFPNQRSDLWKRSRIHLQKHLQTAQPTEPVSLILTAGFKGERTLRCLAHELGAAFSSALNASVLHIDGASKAGQDSDQVKLDIDTQLQSAFEGNKPVAVIDRFEELPPGSTLIFYRYCDHENAAFKKTFLIFTVLLGEEEEIPPQVFLSTVEEMVDDYLQSRFLSHGRPVAFDRMDINKYAGLWSRISHLILPVAAEAALEHGGC